MLKTQQMMPNTLLYW